MKMVMGGMNGVFLLGVMEAATGKCSRVTAAVAYATQNSPFFDHCLRNKIFLDFFGLLDEDQAVNVAVLQKLIEAGPLAAVSRLIKGHFHSKIIWWHGYGAYIGSANLTASAWSSNVECGVFYEEDEIIGSIIQQELELQFDYLRVNSSPVSKELLNALKSLRTYEAAAFSAKQKLLSQFQLVTKGIPEHAGLAAYGSPTKTTAFTRFTSEWNQTLELIRGLSRDFDKLGLRPKWVSPNANPIVHFDQFLHAFYYVRVREERAEDESTKSVELVNRAFLECRENPSLALMKAAEWWASLEKAPYEEDVFISQTSVRMQESFSKKNLAAWTLFDFKRVFYDIHAFKMHARQVKNEVFNLPAGTKESIRERSDRLATWLWEQERDSSQMHIRELLEFLIWGNTPKDMSERLWIATSDLKYRYSHLGPSSLGEAVGWARPNDYPPRNNRTNKALRSLGHDIRLFSS